MKPKEKAIQLVEKYYKIQDSEDLGNEQLNKDMESLYKERGEEIEPYWRQLAKSSALIALDEVLDSLKFQFPDSKYLEQWQEVKEEINKL